MSSDEPEFEPDERPETEALDDGMGPGVGNVLGFSLLFRERRALLALNRRSLATGVRLREYEAVIPGVRFPLRGPLNATKFRKRRCRVVRATLAVEDRALRPWLRERLVGQVLLGVKIGDLELDLRRELPEAEQPRPCLMISGETDDGGQIWLLVAFDVEPVHRLLLLRPCRLWLVGNLQTRHEQGPSEWGGAEASVDARGRDTSARRLWSAIARRLAGKAIAGIASGLLVGDEGTLTIDAGRLAMTRPFASVGWKAPNLEGCAVDELALTRRGLTLELRGPLTDSEPGDEDEFDGDMTTPPSEPPASMAARAAVAPVPGEPGLLDEPIARGLDRARELLRASRVEGGDMRPALERLAELSRELHEFPAAHLALVRWRVTLARFSDREACLEAVHEWLDLQPSAREPRRLWTALLAGSDRAQELARLLASECRQPHEPVTQARLELAVAHLLIDRLDDPRSALTIVAPLTQRLREQISARRDRRSTRRGPGDDEQDNATLTALRELVPEALVVLARARVAEIAREGRSLGTVPHVLEALEEALEATRNPRRRADLRAAVAESFARYGAEHGDDRRGDLQALALLEAAIADDPDDRELLDRAIDIAARTDERATAAKLLRARLARAAAHERASLRKRLIAVAAELDDREHRELARRELTIALEQEPDNAVLLRRAAVLERKLGDARAAAEFIGRLLELDESGEVTLDDRDALVLDRARLLRRAGQIDEAWESLRPALALVPENPDPHDDAVAQRWILDVIELALELAPPTDRPRILDQLIAHASGQRRGEALVERAAQALRVDERLIDLWAAVDELDAPQKILAQIEQLLDDRDHDGLARLAEVALRLRERATELHARARLGRALLEFDELEDAARQLERALELAPDRIDLRHALADTYERSDRIDEAIPLLQALLRDDREATPDERGRLGLRLASLLRAVGGIEEAAELLAAVARELSRNNSDLVSDTVREAVADESFAALRELAEDDRALALALEQAARLWPSADESDLGPERSEGVGPRSGPSPTRRREEEHLGAWLARAARVLDEAGVEELGEFSQLLGSRIELPDALPRTRVALLERAVELRPDDHELADGLEAVLRELGDVDGLEQHLRRQIERNADPELRAGLLERLVASLEASLQHEAEADGRRSAQLAELLEELLTLRPEHTTAMLTLGRLRFEGGDATEARHLWALAGKRLAVDDPRFFQPALELSREALDRGEIQLARELAERARNLEPQRNEPLVLLGLIAREQADPSLAAEVLAERVALDDEAPNEARLPASDRAMLEQQLALALADCFARDNDRRTASAAIDHFAAAERLVPAQARTHEALRDRRAQLERWLTLALATADLEQQARARAALRETLGRELEVPALIAELELLDRGLDRPLAALERCEAALIEREADPALVDALARLLAGRRDAVELAERGQRILRALIKEQSFSAGRTRAAELLVELGQRLDDPASVAFALDQLAPERVEQGELARLRDWAVRKLGRVHEEIGSIESKLASGGLAGERRQALVERLLALFDHERERTAARLLELAEQAEREVAALLADEALAMLEGSLGEADKRGDQRLLELGIDGLRKLARYGSVEAVVRRWPSVELAVREGVEAGAGLRPLAHLVELAVATEHPTLGAQADALLAEQLPDHPDDTRLLRGLWSRTSGEVLLQEGERGRATIVARAATWLEELIRRRELDARTAALLFDGLASLVVVELDEQAAATLLRQRAEAHIRDTEMFSALLRLLENRRCWPEILSLLTRAVELELPPADRVDVWLTTADAAGADRDTVSEARGRERAGELLGRRAGLFEAGDVELDEQAAARAIVQLERALELQPDHATLRWRLGLALTRLGRTRAAFDHLVVIWDREQWSQAGIELGELALRSGELAASLGEATRAVELLSAAHARAGTDRREQATEALFAALLAVERRDDAVRLASARASELEQPQAAVAWLRRAAALAEGARRVELLTRAGELAPEDAALSHELEHELRELGDLDALETLLRERIARCRAAANSSEQWIAAIEALIELLGRDVGHEEPDEQAERGKARQAEIVALYEELLGLAPEHTEALMIVAAEYRRRERGDEALALWARAEPRLRDDDPRLFEVARRLAERRASERAVDDAHRLLERALKLRPDDLDALEHRHALACALDRPELVLTAASDLLAHGTALPSQRLAELHGDVARACSLLGDSQRALAAIERAVVHVEVGSALHRTLVDRWLELLELPDATGGSDPLAPARRELAARVELRRALGPSLARADSLREWELLVTVGEWDRAGELLETLLIAEPEAEDLRTRLRQLDGGAPERGLGERGLRSLRRVVDALAAGAVRDELARELARSSRTLEAARTALDALDRLSGQVAAEPEMLDLRVWAVRKLDRVEDELRELEALLAGSSGDPILVDRLLRVLEHDAEACATRLTEIATRTGEPTPSARTQVWLLESALLLLREHAPDRTGLGVRALAALVDRIGNAELLVEIDHDERAARERVAEARRSWQQLAAAALTHAGRDRRALEQVCALISMADRAAAAALPGFAELGEMLLDRATVDFPDHVPLHLLARQRGAEGQVAGQVDPGTALERLERLAETHRMDPRGRARLYLGLAATLSDEPGELPPDESGIYARLDAAQQPRSPRRKFLRDLAGYHASEPAIFGPLREALRQLGAFTELLAVFEAVAVEAEQWLDLAEDAGAAGDRTAEAAARRRAGNALFERVLAEERGGGGLAAGNLERACTQLARAIELEPGDAKTEFEYGRALERAGRFDQAFALLVGLIDERRYEQAGVELGLLARRCGLLAIEIGERERAAALLRQAYDALPRPRARISVAERLFELLIALARTPELAQEAQTWNAQASALARELAELVEGERARAISLGDPGALAGLDPLPWLERAARLASDEQERADLYAKVHALAPDDERLADAYEASLRALGRNDALAGLLRRRIASGLQAGDRVRTVAQIERMLALLEPLARLRDLANEPEARERIRDRAELLEQLLRLAPDRLEPRLELASLRLLEGDREAAAGHWRMLAQRLPSHDRRFFEPARSLARFAIDSGELEQARTWLERARAIEPNDRTSLEQLLEVARGLDQPELVLSTSALLLEQPGASPTSEHSRAALLRERARAFERLHQPSKALTEIRAAAAVSEPGSDDHVEAARQWLRLATRDGVRVLLREDEARAQAAGEAEARAELRRALGQQLPPRAYIAEAELLAERLGQRGQAIELLLTGLARHLGDADLLATYEELCTVSGEQRRFVRSLAELLATAQFDDPSARVRLGEKLARSARAIDDPTTCIEALEALPNDVAERPELLELRDWAVRGLGGVDEELARLDERILALEPGASPERLQAIVSRMLRLLGDAGEPVATRLLGLADAPGLDPELARALARSALRVAREYAPEHLGVAITALRASLARESIKAVAALWPGVENLALETNELGPLVELFALALAAERDGENDYGRRADRLASAALRLAPGDRGLHELLLARVGWTDDDLDGSLARVCASLDGFVQELELEGPALAQMWSAALELLEQRQHDVELGERIAELLRARVELAIDTPESFAALLELLRARGRWDLTLELLLRADQRHRNLSLAQLDAVALAAAQAHDDRTRLRARIELGTRRTDQRDCAGAAEAFADALAAAPERADLQYRLGDALARAGRNDAALEQLLPLLGRDELATLLVTITEQLGPNPGAGQVASRDWNLRLDVVALARRCAELLVAVDSHERAATLFERAHRTSEVGDPRREAIAEALFSARVRLGEDEAAASVAATAAAEARDRPEQRVMWLLRVAERGDPRRKVEALAEAHALRPSDELATRLEAALEALGEDDRLETLLLTRVEQARMALREASPADESDLGPERSEGVGPRSGPSPTRPREVASARERGAEALRKLIELRRTRTTPDPTDLASSWAQLLEFVPDDLEAMLALAEARDRAGDPEAAASLWRRAGELLPREDDRFFAPAMRLAELARARAELDDARALLERALAIRPGELDTLEALRSLAVAADDPELRIRAIEALLEQPDRADQRAALELEAANAHALLAVRRSRNLEPDPESLGAAVAAFERAASAAEVSSPLHREIAKTWLELVATDSSSLISTAADEELRDSASQRERLILAREREAAARAQLRVAFGGNLAPGDLRTEASLLALGLGRVDQGLSLVEAALLDNPDDPLLLSAFKDLCLATGAQERYAEALDAAIAVLPEHPPETRDRLATELAFTAVELEDANRLLAQLERMSPERASSPELLDLREWAIRKLGRVEHELTEIDEELLATSSEEDTAVLVERLLRMLDQNYDDVGRRLAMLAGRARPDVATRLRDATLELARSAGPSYFDVLLGIIEQSLVDVEPGRPPAVNLGEHWAAIEKLALERDDPSLLALLLDLGYRATESGLVGLGGRVAELRDLSLIRHPDSPELHALVFGSLEVELASLDRETRLARADAALAELAERLRTTGRKRARLWVGFAKLFDRRDGAALLARRARTDVEDNATFLALVDALEEGNHWTRALDLLEYRVSRDGDAVRQVADLKHLAHLCADILGDPDAAIGHLERALEYAPEDPDLMLPLLDHYYAQPQLDRAIDLSDRVLEHVPMGAVAFAALGHRAADAALATGQHPLAEKLLRKILERAPDDSRTRDRLRELEQLADDPEHRVRMLAAIANRTSGSARVEALEERARLLVDPLGRIEEAIADLEAVIEDAPGRRATATMLANLYEQRQRWPALVATLEREYPRQQGLDRVLTLERIALIQRDRLDEPARAEKALRLALDNLDSVGIDRLAELLDENPPLRAELLELDSTGKAARAVETDATTEAVADALFDSVVLPDGLTRPPTTELERAPPSEPVSLEQARQAWARLADRLHLEIVSCLERQGRFSELIAHLEAELAPEFAGDVDPRERFPGRPVDDNPRLLLMQRLAKALRDHVDDGERTAQAYVRLEQLDALPDEGLATLARWYRGQQRYDDLVRILTVRSRKLAALGDLDRKAEADFRIGELLEGPLRRPHEAARFFLDAYLANPFENPAAGARARVLLAGTDSVINVRNRLLMRLPELRENFQPALLTLLADLLSPHDDHEAEAERRYREALALSPDLPNALEGLGRLLSRQGRLDEAIEPLIRAARSPDIADDRAADDAASAARALVELGRGDEAEAVLVQALTRAPESQRSLLEMAKLYDRLGRKQDEARVLERLAGLPLSSMLRAEVGYRQAMLLASEFRGDPMSEAGERARALLLEAVGADAMHAQARQTLLELASARSEWSIVAHMHFLAIRELPSGPRRALTHLDLAETYLDRLSDAQSAVRNLGAALQQAPEDVVVVNRANTLVARMPDPGDAAQRLEQFSKNPGRPELGEPMTNNARARLLLVASDLHLRNDTLEPAEAAARAANELGELSAELGMEAGIKLDQIVQIDQGEFDLRKRRKSLHNKLEQTEDPVERLSVLARLRETARALGDRPDLEDVTRRQLELAHALLEEVERPREGDTPDPGVLAARKAAALAGLRNVFAESGDYARVVTLYEDLASRTGDANEAAELLTSAARFAWSGLRDPKLAVAIVRRALDRAPTHAPATTLLGEIAGASDEPEVDQTICDELSQLAPRHRAPLLTLRLAEAALRLERREHAQGVLRQLLAGEAPVELRLQASSLLDGLLDAAGRTHDRIPLLEERLELCRRHWPDRAADVALDLARAQRAVGNLQDARATCRTTLLDKPSDQPLTKLYAELLEQAEDWPALARALEQLANLTIETREQAHWLTRAAQVHLDHGTDGRESIVAARRLLERARAVSIESTEARAVLLPLAFHQGDWERTLDLAIELRAISGDEHEALIYAALTEAFARGKRTLARSIGDRHDRIVRQRVLWPVCARMLELIATEGPLPRLDALLSAAAALCGGTEELLDELGAWAAGQPLRAGLALGLARLNEAFRRMELARHLYQIAAFMAPTGPVPVLTTRLPAGELPRTPIHEESWIPLEWRGALREVMLQLRDPLAGVRGKSGSSRPGRTPKERLAVQHAAQAVSVWRGALGVEFSIAVTEQPLVAGIGVRNLAKPTIVVNEGFVDVPEVERRYRLAYAAAALATGLALVLDDDPIGVPDLLDALMCLVKPRHEPTTDAARGLVDTLAARGLTASKLDADLRRSLARELDHWRSAPAKLERIMHRACMLIAARLSGHVDGALAAMARDRGLLAEAGKPVDPAVLETSNAAWLLRALGVFGGHG
jgi:tetratricopeptide (TPR) repeat protein